MGCNCGGSTPQAERKLTAPQQRAQSARQQRETERQTRAQAARPAGANRPALEGIYWNGPKR